MSDEGRADDPLSDFHAGQRKRRRIALAATAGALALLTAAWAGWRATALPALPEQATAEVAKAMDSLGTSPREQHAPLAAAAMVTLEGARLPAAMVKAFDEVTAVPPERVGEVAMRPFAADSDSLQAWTAACSAGPQALLDYGASGDIDALFADCQLGRWSLIDGTEARRKSAGRLILAHAAWGWLVDHHSETELERRVLRVFCQG